VSSLCELLGLERDGRSHESGGLTEWKEVERWKWREWGADLELDGAGR
jgi:hypothetical protein